jgi:hypothetical protein
MANVFNFIATASSIIVTISDHSVILAMMPTPSRTGCPLRCPLLDMLNMPPMPTPLTPHKQTLYNCMADCTPSWRSFALFTPPSTIIPGQALATLGAGCVHSGGLLVHGVHCRQGTLAQNLEIKIENN